MKSTVGPSGFRNGSFSGPRAEGLEPSLRACEVLVVELVIRRERAAVVVADRDVDRVDVLRAERIGGNHATDVTFGVGLEVARESRRLVLDPAVDLAVQVGDRRRERTPRGQIDARSRAELVVAADRKILLDAELAGWRARDEVDRAARRVAPEERSLRTSEHLDTFDVRDVEAVGRVAAEVDAIEVDTDAVVDLAL